MPEVAKIQFWPHTTNTDIASFRLRCQRVEKALFSLGVNVERYRDGNTPQVLVLSKRYDEATMMIAKRLRSTFGTKLILDICDNHFAFTSTDEVVVKRAKNLRNAIQAVDMVIASSDYLSGVIRHEVPSHPPIQVIGDLVDPPSSPSLLDKLSNPIEWLNWKKLDDQLVEVNPILHTRLVWFGNHGSDYVTGGMNDIRRALPALLAFHIGQPLSLTVISNSRRKFEILKRETDIPMLYMPWSGAFFSLALKAHAVCIIPINANPFTMAKTGNRVATALVHGLVVVADSIPSYRAFEHNVFLDDWPAGLHHACQPRDHSKPLLDQSEVNTEVVSKWRMVLEGLLD